MAHLNSLTNTIKQSNQGGKRLRQMMHGSVGFRVLVHEFRKNSQRQFFLSPAKGPHKAAKKDTLRSNIIALRKQNLSIYDISNVLKSEGHKMSPVNISLILKQEGFARLPRRRDEERPAGPHPIAAEVADVRKFDLTPRHFRTKFGGLFLIAASLDETNIPIPWLGRKNLQFIFG